MSILVRKDLTKLHADIESEILALDWSPDKLVTEVTAFETHARMKRYRALGKACYENGLNALLTGHHLDDNVETAILRLTQHSKREGLAGIAPVARIPECYGLWGLSESGSYEMIDGRHQRLSTGAPFHMATGGILLCRPLLPFSKSSILETCSENNVPFVSDPTNFDATLTTRNAIRSLLADNKLPRALQPASMSVFLSQNRDSLRNVMRKTDTLLQKCKLQEFHAGSSTMKVKFPLLDELHPLASSEASARIAAAALRRITELVSPLVDGKRIHSLDEYDRFASKIFSGRQMDNFTVAGTYFRLLPNANSKGGISFSDNVWHVSRAPFRTRFEPTLTVGDLQENWCPPVLWDNRFWFQFRLSSSAITTASSSSSSTTSIFQQSTAPTVKIRPLKSDDMMHVDMAFKRSRQFKKTFGFMAPLKSRFTLPIMTTTSTLRAYESDATVERHLALPTLGAELSDNAKFGIDWKWGYRQIDVEALRLMGWLKTGETV